MKKRKKIAWDCKEKRIDKWTEKKISKPVATKKNIQWKTWARS